jgi:hypothetical protein
MTDTTENTQAEPQQEAPAEGAAELNLNDLAAMKQIIDIASQRGTFKANEMAAVGTLYNKLSTFLDTVAKQSEAQKAATPGA